LKYKEVLAKAGVGTKDFEALPSELKFQLVRLLVNPGKPGGMPGTKFWPNEVREERFERLFDFSTRTYYETRDTTKVSNIVRRTTINTARALHYARDIFFEDID